MRPGQILKKKKRTVDRSFHLLTGVRNIVELAQSSDEDETPPLPPKTPNKPLLSSLLSEAKTGGQDYVSPEKKKESQQKKEEYERAHRRDGRENTPLPEQRRQPEQSVPPTGAPNLQMLQNLGHALKTGTAFQRGSTYRPNDPYRPERPQNDRRPHPFDNFYPPNSSQHSISSSQVSFCPHQHLCIEWDPLDPDNNKGSWKLRMKEYIDCPTDHKSCPAPDPWPRGKILAERIIEKFVKMENDKLTPQDRRAGKEPRRPPPNSRVEREIKTMFTQMCRKNEKTLEKREAARVKMNAQDRKKELETTVLQQAQQERQRRERAKGLVDDLEDSKNPVAKSKKLKKADVKSGADVTQRVPLQKKNENRKATAAPEKRYKSSTIHEKEEQLAPVAKQDRQDRTAVASQLARNEKKKAAPKRTETSKKSQTAQIESKKNAQDSPRKLASGQLIPQRSVWGPDSSEEEEYKPTSPTQVHKTAKKQQDTPKPVSKPTQGKMTTEERALLAGIKQAEEEEVAQYVANNEPEPTSSTAPSGEDNSDKLSGRPLAPPQSTKKPVSKKCKASADEKTIDEEESQQKKARKSKKSDAIVENSDDDADYVLPDAPTKLAEAMVNHGWQAEGAALVEEVVHHQEEEEEHKKAEEKEHKAAESTKTQDAVEISESFTATETISTTQTSSSPSKKRKRSLPFEQAIDASSTEQPDNDPPPTKIPKPSSPEETTTAQEQVPGPRTPTPSTPELTASPPPAQTPPIHHSPHASSSPPQTSLAGTAPPSPKRKNSFSDSAGEESSSKSRPVNGEES